MEHPKIAIRTEPIIPYINAKAKWEDCRIGERVLPNGEMLDFLTGTVFRESLSFRELQEEFRRFLETGESQHFAWCYRISEKLGVVIDHHITLYDISPDSIDWQKEFIDWCYSPGCKYLADTWWFDDEEVLYDLTHMTTVDFFAKYK